MKYIIFGSKKIVNLCVPFQICIDGYILEKVDNIKFLGVMIDSSLNWTKHINHVSLKISKGIGIIGRLRKIVPHHIVLPYIIL